MTKQAMVLGWIVAAASLPAWAQAPSAGTPPPAFTAQGREFAFNTGAFAGVLRADGGSRGLARVVAAGTSTPLAGAHGLFSHYRLLDADSRYGTAAWDWASTARLLPDGAVEARWQADATHPFDMTAEYRWSAPDTFDVTTRVTAQKDLKRLEVFLASYFQGFPHVYAYVKGNSPAEGRPAFVEANQPDGHWQMFPRDEASVATINDGRWTRPPNPVAWTIRPLLAGPVALRRDPASGLAAVLMAPAADCFALSMPYGEEGHRSVYLSLFGRDVKAGQSATARSRLVLRRGITDDQAIALYQSYEQSNLSK